MRPRLWAALGGLVAVGVLPSAAQAATKSVSVGTPRPLQKTIQSTASDVNDFFPHRVTIHVGDTVRFVPNGFHTVDLPRRGRTKKLALFVPTGQPVSGVLDAAGAPFWFNGQPRLGFNPRLAVSGFGKQRTYSGASSLNSGLPTGNRPKPMTVRFTRAGTYRYFCDVHYGMTGIVSVVRAGRRVPSAAQDRATVNRQSAAALRVAKGLAAKAEAPPQGPANTVTVGLEGAGRVSWFGFAPAKLTVPVGTTVAYKIGARSEVHTATTGPGNPETQPTSYLGQLTASLESPAPDPRALYPSDPPPAPPALTPTFHGNGFWNTGGLDLDPGSPVPGANTVRFSAPGTYEVYCLIHPFMHQTVTVQ
jgi:plastocyanin